MNRLEDEKQEIRQAAKQFLEDIGFENEGNSSAPK